MVDDLELIEKRIAHLESLVGKFDKIDNTKGFETLLDVSNKLTSFINSNSKIAAAFKLFNDIQKYKAYDFLNEVEDDAMINSKIELILSEEQRYKSLHADFQKLSSLMKVLDDKTLNDVPKLTEKLKDISSKEPELKDKAEIYKNEIKDFLVLYYDTMKSVNETMNDLNEYLDQFDPEKKPKSEE